MIDPALIIVVVIFCLWQCSAIAFTLKGRRDSVFTTHGFLTFCSVGVILACIRLASYWYLAHRMSTHTYDGTLRPLELLLLPDALFLQLMNLSDRDWSSVIIYTVIFLCSFAWAFPILFFTSRKKPNILRRESEVS